MSRELSKARREALAEALHAQIDGDFLVGAGWTGGDLPVSEAGAADVVRWATDALAPLITRWLMEERAAERQRALAVMEQMPTYNDLWAAIEGRASLASEVAICVEAHKIARGLDMTDDLEGDGFGLDR